MKTKIRDALGKVEKDDFKVFRFLSDDEKELLLDHLEWRSLSAGEVLWEEGSFSENLVFILNGRVNMKKQTEFPGKQVVIGIYTTGSILGATSFLDGSKRPWTAKAYVDTELGILTRENFDDIVENHPTMGINLFKGIIMTLSSRLKESFERLASIF
jgi:CRP-like cAMP-binding protein